MRVAYLAGPYRAPTENALWENIAEARRIAVELWKLGYVPICPHMNSAFMGGVVSSETFLAGDLEIISQLDPERACMVMMPEWLKSTGAQGEHDKAMERNMLVYYWPDVPRATA